MSSSDQRLYTKGTRVWVKDDQTVWKAATVGSDFAGEKLVVVTDDDGEQVELSDLPPLRNPEILIGENDLTSLSYLHEPAVLHNLAVRFLENQSIYTYCGIVLVAINPYQELPIYGNDTIAMYRGKNMGDLDPHIYAVAEEAFTKMERENTDQSIIVSGESGAGKTVSAKYAMRYFATVGGTSQTETQVEKRVLASSPIMEAIGNAKTTRNDNSSRFGKYIEIDFNKHFHIIGASMRTYLLEKSRVVFQASEERNYHIFYQMCAARELQEFSDLALLPPDEFAYTYQGESYEIEGVDDLKEFLATQDAFHLLGFSETEQKNIFKILAAILHLGNLQIVPGSGKSDSETSSIPVDDGSIHTFSKLLGIEEDQLRKWLCNRKIVTSRETYTKPMGAEGANFAKDALAKFIYSIIFDWIVIQINKSLKTNGRVHKFIGVLDIYGFETFEVNSFEQFCINYANEKLQQQFNQHVFKLEQEEYLKEGIEWNMIDFYDNQPCIDLIESKLGILDLLDEECRMPKGSDQSWVQKLYDKCSKCEHFAKPRLSQSAFIVGHFADRVEYECHGFLDKNRDTVMAEQISILRASTNDFVSDLFLEETPRKGPKKPPQSSSKQHKKTVGSQFRDSLNLLMAALNCTTPHYVRCIKPNDVKASFQFDPRRGVQQLRACGVLETVRISAAGYPSRWTYHDFFVRYRVLCHSKDVKQRKFRTICENIVQKLINDEDKYQFGRNKLFFRAGQVAYMEKLRSERLRDCGIMIQKHVKGWLYRKRYRNTCAATLTLQRWSRGFLARKRVRFIRRTKAAVVLQKSVRAWVKRTQYQRLYHRTLRMQARIRGVCARRRHEEIVRRSKAIIIQTWVRRWLALKRYQQTMRRVVLVQCQIRRFLAKKKLKKFKIEARSMEHQKKLNQGLENKIISLQQKLTESEKTNKELRIVERNYTAAVRELDTLRTSHTVGTAAVSRVADLEKQMQALEAVVASQKGEIVDLVTEKQKAETVWQDMEGKYKEEITQLKNELSNVTHDFQKKEDEASNEILKRLTEEKDNINSEYDQERIAYQKLLKAYNRLEVQFENAQDELRQFKNLEPSTSMLSMADGEDDSAYGSQYGRSSEHHKNENDVTLTVKLQHKLKETQMAKEHLERRLEDLESMQGHIEPQASDAIKLQEYEVENEKVKEECRKLRKAICDELGDNEGIKEILENYEVLQDEVERRREECIQLRSLLANVSLDNQPLSLLSRGTELPETEELFLAYETQKSVIAQLQAQLNDEKAKSKEVEAGLRDESDKLAKICSEQQQLIHQSINKTPANNTEACLQHEITRLTSENFDLREKIEVINDNTKRLKRVLKMCMKKLADAGATVDISESTQIDEPMSFAPSITIRKKEHDYLGMFEYKKEAEQQILKALIYDLKPKMALQMLPGLPSYMLFMMIRYTDYINNDESVRSLIQGAISMVKKVIKKKGMNDLDVKTLWLSNILRILHNLKQYSGEKQFQGQSSPKQIEQCLRNFDLSEYRRVLCDIAIWIYQGITKLMEEEVLPILVPAVLEHEGIGGISGDMSSSGRTPAGMGDDSISGHVDPHEALDKLLRLLTRFNMILSKHGLDPEIIAQIFKQIFYFICAGSLNNLLLRKDMCHWSRGMQIRYNVAQLEQWYRDQKIHDQEKCQVIDSLAPIIQASQLLQARKSDEDVQTICDMCDSLKVSQIIKILNLYTPADEFEERVTPSFVRKIQAKLSSKATIENEQQITLLMDTKFSFAVMFPFCPSTIQLEELEVPEFYNSLQTFLKKV